jgi:hypothetical protein
MVSPSMIFYNFFDFYENAECIKAEYARLSVEQKRVYKMYVYSNRLIKEFLADKIWEYLNEPFGSAYYISRDMLGAYL